MTQNIPDNPSSPHPSYMGLPDTFDYMQEQFGGGRRNPSPPVELTPSRLRSKLKATERDAGLVKGASTRRQAYQRLAVEGQDPAPNLPHAVPAAISTSETSSSMLHVGSSRHASPFPAPHAPEQLQDVFFGSMNQPHAWMDPNSSDTFSMMGSESYLSGGSQNHFVPQDMDRLAPPPSYTFPASSSGLTSRGCSLDPHATGQTHSGLTEDLAGKVSPFVLQPVPSSSSHDHLPALPTTNVIPPTPFKDGDSTTSTNTIGTLLSGSNSQMDLGGHPSTSRARFPEEHEPVTHDEGLTVTGRRSAEVNAALDVGFAAVERCFLELATSTTLPTSQLINLFLKSRGRTVNGTNYWNLYANYFKEHMQIELARIGKEAQAGGGTPSKYYFISCCAGRL
jgi:hypothetical protein